MNPIDHGQTTADGTVEGLQPTHEMTLELREEELIADKRTVSLGRVRLRRQLVKETRTIDVVVMREEFTLERISDTRLEPDQPIDAADSLAVQLGALAPGETVRVPIVEEEIIIQKRPMVTRELIIGKRVVKDVRQFSDTLRREDARVTFEPASPDAPVAPDPYFGSSRAAFEQRPRSASAPLDEQQRTVELREEEMEVRTQTVEKGVVEVHTGVVLERGSVAVELLHEEVTVDEHEVEAHPAERQPRGGDTYEMPEYGEEVSLRKRPVVVEEITIGLDTVQANQEITTTLLREEALVEVEGDVSLVERERPDDRRSGRGR